MATLFDSLTAGEIKAPNRIIMAPLTRNRSSKPSEASASPTRGSPESQRKA